MTIDEYRTQDVMCVEAFFSCRRLVGRKAKPR